jgi:hypothetical protein
MNILKLFLTHFLLSRKEKRVVKLVLEYNDDESTAREYKVLRKIFGVNVCCIHDNRREATRWRTGNNKIAIVKLTIQGDLS